MKRRKLWSLLVIMELILAACAPTASPTIRHFTFVPPEAETLCESAFSSPETTGSASTPVRTLISRDYEGKQWEHEPNIMVVPHVEPRKASEVVHTLLCIRESRAQEITYQDGEVGYRVSWDVRLVLYPGGEVIGAQEFEGDQPPDVEEWERKKEFYPSGPFYGERPTGRLLEWLFPTLGDRTVFCYGFSVFDIAISPDGGTLAAGGSSNMVKLWDVATGEQMGSITLSTDVVYVGSLAFSSDGKALATPGFYPNPVQLWDVTNGKLIANFSSEEPFHIFNLIFSPDGRMLASGDWNGAVHLWDVASGQVLRTLNGHTESIESLAFSPDGRLLASGSFDGSVILWDVNSGQNIHSLEGHTDSVDGVVFSPDGSMIASGSQDNSVILWDAGNGQQLYRISADFHVSSIAFSPDGKILAFTDPIEIKLWDIEKKEIVATLDGHTQAVRTVIFTPDGKKIISGSIDTTVKLWVVPH